MVLSSCGSVQVGKIIRFSLSKDQNVQIPGAGIRAVQIFLFVFETRISPIGMGDLNAAKESVMSTF